MLKFAALGAIRFYQTVLSPYKGFRCAYAASSGCPSCSVLGYRAIRRFGVRKGVTVLRWRFEECSAAFAVMKRARPMALGKQGGECDCDCGGSDSCDNRLECLSGVSDCFGSDDNEKKKRPRNQPGP